MENIVGDTEILLSPEEADLYVRQVEAQSTADTSKVDADYQNEPSGKEQCDTCSMFVPGLPDDIGGYCSKVQSFRGPLGMIFPDGWCKFFAAAEEQEDEELDDISDLDDLDGVLSEGSESE